MIIQPRNDRGSVLLFVAIILTVMVIISLTNTKTLAALQRELRLIDHRQQMRWDHLTNSIPAKPITLPR